MHEFRQASDQLGRAGEHNAQRQAAVIAVLTSLRAVLDEQQRRIAELETRQGKLSSQAAEQAAYATVLLLRPIEQQLQAALDELQQIAADVAELKERAVGERPRPEKE
jgi:hypothetical protein